MLHNRHICNPSPSATPPSFFWPPRGVALSLPPSPRASVLPLDFRLPQLGNYQRRRGADSDPLSEADVTEAEKTVRLAEGLASAALPRPASS
jgi:hypothetical protein